MALHRVLARRLFVGWCVFLAGCTTGYELGVDVRTDLVRASSSTASA